MFIESESTGELTESQLILSRSGNLSAVQVYTDGTNKATVTVYDSLTGSGKKVGKWAVPGASEYGGRNYSYPVKLKIGLYITISGTGASAIVEYI